MRLLSTWALRCALGVSYALLLGSLSGCEEPEAAAEKAPVVEVAKPAPQKVVKPKDSHKVPHGERLVVLDFSREALGDASAGDRVDILGMFHVADPKSRAAIDSAEAKAPVDPTIEPLKMWVSINMLQHVLLHKAHCVEDKCSASFYMTIDESELFAVARPKGELFLSRRSAQDSALHPVYRRTLREVIVELEVFQEIRKQILKKGGLAGRATSIFEDDRVRVCTADTGGEVVHVGAGELAATFTFPDHNPHVLDAKAGDWIDILGAFEVHGYHNVLEKHPTVGFVSMTLLQRVRIIKVDEDRFTLLLTPDEVEMLRLARQRGKLHYLLRNSDDASTVEVSKRTLKEVLEELEIIQMERRKRRVKRRRKKKPSGIVITSGRGSGSSSHATGSVPAPTPSVPEAPKPSHNEDSDARSSTFGLDVDAGSYTRMREQVKRGRLPQADEVRLEEYLNYFDWNLPQPENGEAMGISFEATPDPMVAPKDRAQHHIVRVGIKARDIAAEQRKPAHLTFLVDTSGSMQEDNRIGKVKDALKVLVANLREKDTVSLVTYAGDARIVLSATGPSQRARLIQAIDDLTTGGSTAMQAGLDLAYRSAAMGFVRGDINRVIVLSDGIANVGATDHEQMLTTIRRHIDKGITLSTIGVGTTSYKDRLMEQLADNGDGNYYFIDSYDEIERVFLEQIDGTLQVVAKDAKVQVNFDKRKVKSFRLLGYENRTLKEEDFKDDTVDAGEVGAGHEVTALYAVTLHPKRTLDAALSVSLRYRGDDSRNYKQISILKPEDIRTLETASAAHRFALGVAAFAEILRDSKSGKKLHFDTFHTLMMQEDGGQFIEQDARKLEFVELYTKVWGLLGCGMP